MTASGDSQQFATIWIKVRLVGEDLIPWSEWIVERAIVKPAMAGLISLSGSGIWKYLYFGTERGNGTLSVGTTKYDMSSLLH